MKENKDEWRSRLILSDESFKMIAGYIKYMYDTCDEKKERYKKIFENLTRYSYFFERNKKGYVSIKMMPSDLTFLFESVMDKANLDYTDDNEDYSYYAHRNTQRAIERIEKNKKSDNVSADKS